MALAFDPNRTFFRGIINCTNKYISIYRKRGANGSSKSRKIIANQITTTIIIIISIIAFVYSA